MPTKVIVQPTSTAVTVVVPDVIVSLQGNTIVTTQPPITQSGGTPITPVPPDTTPGQPVVFTIPQVAVTDPRYHAGANQFYLGNGQQSPIPTNPFKTFDNDMRFNWLELQTTDGVIKSNNSLDSAISKCMANNWKLSFGVVSCNNGNTGIYPSFAGSSGVPDWNSEQYLSAVERFLMSLAAYIISKGYTKYISHIDIRLLGNWGEFHYFGIAGAVATSASVKRIIDAHTKAFPDIQLISVISAYQTNSQIPTDAAAYLLMASNNVGKVGIRSDHLGDPGNYNFDTSLNTTVYQGINFNSEIMNRWKVAPVIGELLNDLNKVSTTSPYNDMLREVQGLHISQFSNSNEARRSGSGASSAAIAASDANLIAASALCGYRLSILGGSYTAGSGTLSLTLNWNNAGIAPVYEKWVVTITIGGIAFKSRVNLLSVLPGTLPFTDNFTGIPAGTYDVSVVVSEPYRGGMQLGIKGSLVKGVVIN